MQSRNNYLGRIDPKDKVWESSPWTELLKERYYIASLLCKNKVVLDSCCGTGWATLNYIVARARFTIGFDVCQSTLQRYKPSNKYLFMVMDARKIVFKENCFDMVLALDSIEHFSRQDGIKYLSGMKRVCKQGGFLVGTTPLVIDESLIPIFLRWNKYHIYMYTRQSLRKALEGIFPFVRIYEIYNRICPYSLFICGKSKASITKEAEGKIKEFILERKREFRSGKIAAYLYWAKNLLKKKDFLKAGHLFYLACFMKMRTFWNANNSDNGRL